MVVFLFQKIHFKKCHFTAVERVVSYPIVAKEQGWNDVSVVLVKGDHSANSETSGRGISGFEEFETMPTWTMKTCYSRPM